MTTITIFVLSLLAISAMIVRKVFEYKIQKTHFINNLIYKADIFMHGRIEKLILFYRRFQQISSIFFFEFLPAFFYEQLGKLKDYVARKYYLAGDQFRGKKILRSQGSVSAFLGALSEDKTDPARHA